MADTIDVASIPFPAPPDTRRWVEAFQTGRSVYATYNPSLDMLAFILEKPRPAWSLEANDGVMYRIDLETNELVALEIYDFKQYFLKKYPEVRGPFLGLFGLRARLSVYVVCHLRTVRAGIVRAIVGWWEEQRRRATIRTAQIVGQHTHLPAAT